MIKRSAEANRSCWHSRTLRAQQGSDSVFISHSDLPSTPRPASVSASLPPAATDWPLWDIYTHITGLYLHNTHNTTHNLLPRSGPGRFPSQVKHTSDTTTSPKLDSQMWSQQMTVNISSHVLTFSCQLHAEDYWRWYSPKCFLVSFLYVSKLNLVL